MADTHALFFVWVSKGDGHGEAHRRLDLGMSRANDALEVRCGRVKAACPSHKGGCRPGLGERVVAEEERASNRNQEGATHWIEGGRIR